MLILVVVVGIVDVRVNGRANAVGAAHRDGRERNLGYRRHGIVQRNDNWHLQERKYRRVNGHAAQYVYGHQTDHPKESETINIVMNESHGDSSLRYRNYAAAGRCWFPSPFGRQQSPFIDTNKPFASVPFFKKPVFVAFFVFFLVTP